MKRVLVTGANGHVGANIVRSLLRIGHEVVPFVRPTSDLRSIEGLGLTCFYGDVMDRKSLTVAADGCDAIIHTAAVFRYWAKNPADIIDPSVAGTQNVFAAAKQADVKRVVYTSSTFAIGSSDRPDIMRHAEDWNIQLHMPYTVAKFRSEREAWRLADEMGLGLVVICPSGAVGPLDYRVTPTMALIRDLVNGSIPTTKAGVSFVDVRDVADIHAKAVDEGVPGQRYIVAGENMLMKEMGAIITKLTGAKISHLGAGRRVTYIVASVAELAAKIAGSEPFMTRAFVKEIIERYHYYDCRKTAQAFGFAPRKTEEMLADAIRWLLSVGQIKARLAKRLVERYPADPNRQFSLVE